MVECSILIDLLITNVKIENMVSGMICADMSDHLLIFLAAGVATGKENLFI